MFFPTRFGTVSGDLPLLIVTVTLSPGLSSEPTAGSIPVTTPAGRLSS